MRIRRVVVRRDSFHFIYLIFCLFLNTAIVFEPLTRGVSQRGKKAFLSRSSQFAFKDDICYAIVMLTVS